MITLPVHDRRRKLDLIRTLVARDIKARYRGSWLGYAWTLLSPLLQLAVFYFIFAIVLAVDVPRYASYVFTGVLVYGWFQGALSQGAYAVTSNSELLVVADFPAGTLPVVTVCTHLVHFLLALPVLIPFLLVDAGRPGLSLAALPVLLAVQFLLTLGLVYFAASLNVLYRDTDHLLQILLRLLFFMTPIFYQVSMVPERFRPLYELNPLVTLVEGYRAVLMDGAAPDWQALAFVAAFSIVVLACGYIVFDRARHRFVEVL